MRKITADQIVGPSTRKTAKEVAHKPLSDARANCGGREMVLGVDTHRDFHVAALLSLDGSLVATERFAASALGYEQLCDWARSFGVFRKAGVEGTGSYGAALSRHLLALGIEVIEVPGTARSVRRRRNKNDWIDARAAAQAVLNGQAHAYAKSGEGPAQIARMYKVAKDSAVKSRTQAINQLRDVLVTVDPQMREELAGLRLPRLLRACTELNHAEAVDPLTGATRFSLRILAERIVFLTVQIRELKRRLLRLLQEHVPQLCAAIGVGPDSGATLLITAGDNVSRLRSEASFAALCGVSPVEYSSGGRQAQRLNRGGDRQANAALYYIVQARLRYDPRTQAYLERRQREGKTRREIIRCLKRYVAREVFTLLHPSRVVAT
ncbi:IS110 family transposase [Streptomyces sp. NPDC056337]|uniref:IS110 family transposase n=1 Tax=Streptomyces sp. NPDC056337 TaxID=3345787 RepID=UPI0035D9D8B7